MSEENTVEKTLAPLDFNALGNQAAESEDLTQNKSYERETPRAGAAFVRLLSYIETGRHEPKNPTHKPALRCIFTFELSHPDHKIEIDGKKVPAKIQIRLNKGSTNKSGYRKLFKVMNQALGEKYTHFAQMIGEAFLAEIYHNTVGEGTDKAQTYANLDLDGAWSFKAPVQKDVINNTETPIPIDELDGTPTVFLWENESIQDAQVVQMWDSILIEGEREDGDKKNEDGTPKMVSKNWIQELIMSNIEWEGSTTQALTQEHINLDDVSEPDPIAETPVASEAPETPATAPTL